MIDWLIDWLIDWPISRTAWSVRDLSKLVCSIDWLIDWLIDWPISRTAWSVRDLSKLVNSIDWLIVWYLSLGMPDQCVIYLNWCVVLIDWLIVFISRTAWFVGAGAWWPEATCFRPGPVPEQLRLWLQQGRPASKPHMQCFGSGWIRIIWLDPDPLQETLIRIRVAKKIVIILSSKSTKIIKCNCFFKKPLILFDIRE